MGDLLRVAVAPERSSSIRKHALVVLRDIGCDGGMNGTRTDAVDRDSLFSEINGHGARQPQRRMLGDGVAAREAGGAQRLG